MTEKLAQLERFWSKAEAPVLVIGGTAGLLVWAYSNFATAKEMSEAKSDLRAYVDQRHGEVKEDLLEIKGLLIEQRAMQNRILLKLSR